MRVYVEYLVPLLVEVDLDEDAVVAVVVDDEQVEGPGGVIAVTLGLSAAEAVRATGIAEADSWPAWSFGS